MTKPHITGTTHELPFDKLSPRDFERLCLWLVEREGFERAEHLGAAGSEQGRDIIAWRGDELWAFQCKRVQRFGPKDALAEVEKVLALPEDQRPVGLVFLVTCDVRADTRQRARERCAGEMECYFWTGTELDEKVKQRPDILGEFFAPFIKATFLTPENRARLEQRYLNTVIEDCRYLQTEGMEEGLVPLTDVFVVLQALHSERRIPVEARFDTFSFPERAEHAGLLAQLWPRKRAIGTLTPEPKSESPTIPVPLSEALKQKQHLVLLGEPGAGKSTTLQFIALCFAQDGWVRARLDLEEERVPVRVDLRAIAPRLAEKRLEVALASDVSRLARIEEEEALQLLDHWQQTGRLVILLDGLDEVPEASRKTVVDEVCRFAHTSQGSRCRIVVSSRVAGYQDLGEPFGEYLLCPFSSSDEALPYVSGWLAALRGEPQEKTRREAKALLNQMTSQGGLRRVTDNPLLLRLAVSVYVQSGEIERSRSTLYRRYVEEVLWERAQKRTVPPFSVDCALNALEVIAWTLQGQGEKTTWDLVEEVREKVANVEDARKCLDFFRQDMGLLVAYDDEGSERRLAFSHRPLHEYFVARRLKRSWRRSAERTWAFLRPRLHHEAWREPILLMAGMLEDATSLVERIQQARSPYERELHRDRRLAAGAVGEGASVSPRLIEKIRGDLFRLLAPSRADSRQQLTVMLLMLVLLAGIILIIQVLGQLLSLLPPKTLSSSDCATALGLIFLTWLLTWALFMYFWWPMGKVLERLFGLLPPLRVNQRALLNLLLFLGETVFTMAVWSWPFLSGLKLTDPMAISISAVWAAGLLLLTLLFGWSMHWAFNLESSPRLGSLVWWPTRLLGIQEEQPVLIACLKALGAKAREPLIDFLVYGNVSGRAYAARLIGEVQDTRAVDSLITALKDSSKEVRQAAAWALGDLEDARAVDSLVAALEDSSEDVRRAATWALGKLGDTRATDSLVAALKDSSDMVRLTAVWALGELEDTRAVDSLIVALRDSSDDVRQAAAQALGTLKNTRAEESLVKVRGDSNIALRQAAARALGDLEDTRAVDTLFAALKDSSEDVRLTAAYALGKLEDTRAVDSLVAALKDSSDEVRLAAAWALGELRSTGAIEPLIETLADSKEEVRLEALCALGQMGDARAIEPLIRRALVHGSSYIRGEAAQALGNLAKEITRRHIARRGARALWWRLTDFGFIREYSGSIRFKRDVTQAAYAALGQVVGRLTELEVAALPASDPLEPS